MDLYKDKLDKSFYHRDAPLVIARELIGKQLCTQREGMLTAGRIVETEAYHGTSDRACHAYGGRRTPRNEVMYERGGIAYVYICYGMHHLFNVVTNQEEKPDAVLIRAVEPLLGTDLMQERRGIAEKRQLTAGPGRLSQALGIRKGWSGESLLGDRVWIAQGDTLPDEEVVQTTRIGVATAGEAAHFPWRFYWRKSAYVSVY